jgi:hypothetical protein
MIKNSKESLAISQILVLVIGIIAISYAIGSSVREVKADDIAKAGRGCDSTLGSKLCEEECASKTSQCYINCCNRIKNEIFGAESTTATASSGNNNIAGAVAAASMLGLQNKLLSTKSSYTSIPTSGGVGVKQKLDLKTETSNAVSGEVTTLQGYTGREFKKVDGTWRVRKVGTESWDEKISDNDLLFKLEPNSLYHNLGKFGTQILKNAGYAVGIYAAIKFLGPMITYDKSAIDSASRAAMVGYFTGTTLKSLIQLFSKTGKVWGISGTAASWIIGAPLAVFLFLNSYKKYDEQKVTFTCNPWEAPLGGANCEKCNKQGIIPCTEYQCKALGQGCELENAGTGEELCIWKSRGDVKAPVITPLNDALPNENYAYKPDGKTSPPDRGVYITYKNGCIPAFTPFTFGIKLDEPGSCKVDPEQKKTFDEMALYFGGSSTKKYNHTQTISWPSAESLAIENVSLKNNGNYDLYVKCMDVNGNYNLANFVFKYCVDKGEDTTPLQIMGTSIDNNMPILYNQSSVELSVYTNEPADCKWNHDRDMAFKDMENNMTCSRSVFEMNAQMLYSCTTTLNGLKSRQDNNFYFRCLDKPLATKNRNEMARGYKFTLIGTQPLLITKVGPNETIKDSTEIVNVKLTAETSAGYKEGEATCEFSETGELDSYVKFEQTNSYTHLQNLYLPEGTYTYSIKCYDLGGNTDNEVVHFKIETDHSPPIVTRAYKEENYLKIITSEKAKCVYGTQTCNYLLDPDGVAMNTIDDIGHFVDWDPSKTYYIKCKDQYGNQPDFNQCNIIVRPFDLVKKAE